MRRRITWVVTLTCALMAVGCADDAADPAGSETSATVVTTTEAAPPSIGLEVR